MIPAQAVEAAAKAMFPDNVGPAYNLALRALEAAAPYMLQSAKADAWEEGREYGIDECAGDVTGGINPYGKAAK